MECLSVNRRWMFLKKMSQNTGLSPVAYRLIEFVRYRWKNSRLAPLDSSAEFLQAVKQVVGRKSSTGEIRILPDTFIKSRNYWKILRGLPVAILTLNTLPLPISELISLFPVQLLNVSSLLRS